MLPVESFALRAYRESMSEVAPLDRERDWEPEREDS